MANKLKCGQISQGAFSLGDSAFISRRQYVSCAVDAGGSSVDTLHLGEIDDYCAALHELTDIQNWSGGRERISLTPDRIRILAEVLNPLSAGRSDRPLNLIQVLLDYFHSMPHDQRRCESDVVRRLRLLKMISAAMARSEVMATVQSSPELILEVINVVNVLKSLLPNDVTLEPSKLRQGKFSSQTFTTNEF